MGGIMIIITRFLFLSFITVQQASLGQGTDCLKQTQFLKSIHETNCSVTFTDESFNYLKVQNGNFKVDGGVSVPVLLFVVLCLLSYGFMTLTRVARMVNRFPILPKFPLIGSAHVFMTSPKYYVERVSQAREKYGRCFATWLLHRPYIVIMEATSAQAVLATSKHIEKGRDYINFKWLMGDGLITSNGQTWHEDRKLLSPSFKYQRFDGFLNSFNKNSKILVEILIEMFPIGERKDAKPQNLHPILSRCTMDIITEAALGTSTSFQRDLNTQFVEATHLALESFRMKVSKPWLVLPIIWDIFGLGREEPKCRKYFEKHLGEVIGGRRKLKKMDTQENEETDTTKPFIDALLSANKSDKEIFDHVITIFGAGFETTASGINYTLYLLALNLEALRKVHEELDQVFGGDFSRDVTFSDLSELKYLEMCLKEAMRLFPPAPLFLRIAQEDIHLENGLVIPKGCDVVFFIYELHRDERVFPDPEKFDPERFQSDQCAKRSHYAYAPFSVGPRNCLGQKYAIMQMKAVLAHVLRKFTISTTQRREDLNVVYGMVLEPLGGIHITLSPRSS